VLRARRGWYGACAEGPTRRSRCQVARQHARDRLGPAAVLAAGAEVVNRSARAIDVQLRSSALYHHGDTASLNTALMLGVAWR